MAEDAAQEKAEATVVQPEDLRNLEVFMLLLSRAANPQVLTSRREQEIQDQASLIWGRLQAIAAVEDEDSPFRELVDQWRKFYELDRPVHARMGIHLLMETEVDGAVALAQAAHTILGFKRPDGAQGANLLEFFLR
ncbi:hypothetical protein E1281_38310 [Actinomadura sp. KC345]|uniref:hypothetical protein n=1 Tax=Actinomadura sp. KC345 TaxID=2530371 RepID=UPI00104FA770|nr:hypothetical protein [Actinomadura sp. KC345]TDC40324.1 hypothetical protein E1281_38310 [Actinomadura sp. KC345]